MNIREILENLATEINTPCVTISLNTHRTHPDNAQDEVQLKNLLKEAEERLLAEFDKKSIQKLLIHLSEIKIDVNYSLDSLHIYLSNDTKEIIKLAWPVKENAVHVSSTFDITALIKSLNRSEEYLILLMSQSGVHLYKAINDGIVDELRSHSFPFSENQHYTTDAERGSDAKHVDDLVREFLNKVDKSAVKVHNETGLNFVVICTEDNYSRLMQVADRPSVYIGHANINYNNTAKHQISKQGWEIVKELQHNRRAKAIAEMKEAVSQGRVLTDLQEIYQAAIDGNGELLLVHQDFSQSVMMTSDRTFDLTDDKTVQNAIDDITSNVAWEVLSKKGNVFFTTQDEIKALGNIVLKTRY